MQTYFKPPTPVQDESSKLQGWKKNANSKYFSDVVVPAGSNFEDFKPINGVTIHEGPKVKAG